MVMFDGICNRNLLVCDATLIITGVFLMRYSRSTNGKIAAVVNALLQKMKIPEHKHFLSLAMLMQKLK